MPIRKEVKLYGELIHQHKPTIRTIIWRVMMDYFAKRYRHKRSPYIDNVPVESVVAKMQAVGGARHFAIVKDNTVHEIIVVNNIIGDLLEQKRLKFVNFDPETEPVARGMEFKDGTFYYEDDSLDKEQDAKED